MKMFIALEFHPGFQPPKESGDYYCITAESGMIQTLPFSARHGKFNTYDWEDVPDCAMRVRWWAKIPGQVTVETGRGMPALGRRWENG